MSCRNPYYVTMRKIIYQTIDEGKPETTLNDAAMQELDNIFAGPECQGGLAFLPLLLRHLLYSRKHHNRIRAPHQQQRVKLK